MLRQQMNRAQEERLSYEPDRVEAKFGSITTKRDQIHGGDDGGGGGGADDDDDDDDNGSNILKCVFQHAL